MPFHANYLIPLGTFLAGLSHILWPKGWRDVNAACSNMACLRAYWAKTSDADVRMWGVGIIVISIVAAFYIPAS